MKKMLSVMISLLLMTTLLCGCSGTSESSKAVQENSQPSMDDDMYKYAVVVYNEAEKAVKKQGGSFDPKIFQCVNGQEENEGTIFYKVDYSDGVSEGENLDGTKTCYAFITVSANSKVVQVDNALDDPGDPDYMSNANERLIASIGWSNEAYRDNASVVDLDIDFIKSNL